MAFSPEGRAMRWAMARLTEYLQELARIRAAAAGFSPEGRAKRAAINTWKEMVREPHTSSPRAIPVSPHR